MRDVATHGFVTGGMVARPHIPAGLYQAADEYFAWRVAGPSGNRRGRMLAPGAAAAGIVRHPGGGFMLTVRGRESVIPPRGGGDTYSGPLRLPGIRPHYAFPRGFHPAPPRFFFVRIEVPT